MPTPWQIFVIQLTSAKLTILRFIIQENVMQSKGGYSSTCKLNE